MLLHGEQTVGVRVSGKVYENALAIELRKCGLKVEQQFGFPVYYKGVIVGDFVFHYLRSSVRVRVCGSFPNPS